MSNIFTGTIPALMTPCTPERKPDYDALVRKGRELIEAGMSAVVYCGSMGDWPSTTFFSSRLKWATCLALRKGCLMA